MKNIKYREYDKRWIGRKRIKGHKILVYAKTQEICKSKLKKEISRINNLLTQLKTKTHRFTLKEWFLKWNDENKKPFVSDDTQKEIMRVFDRLEPLHSTFIEDLTKDRIISFLKPIKHNRTKEKIELYFKAAITSAFNDGLIKINPFANLRLTPVKKSKKKSFTYEQQKNILEKIKHRPIYAPIMVYLLTGMRKNEFDTQNILNNISTEHILKSINLKGRNKVVRYKEIKLSNAAVNLIKQNSDTIKKYTTEEIYREFATIMTELGIKGSIVNLRHTYATNNFYLGTPELIISRQMGHSTSQITKDIYTDIDYNLSKQKVIELYGNLYPEF